MISNWNSKSVVVFDLDDTLFQEIDYLKSAYREIAEFVCSMREDAASEQAVESLWHEMLEWYVSGQNPFGKLLETYTLKNLTITDFVKKYRHHFPNCSLNPGAQDLLQHLIQHQIPLGLITDGYSVTQRNKLKALGIESYFHPIVISEEWGSMKPCLDNYLVFQKVYPGRHYYYIGDNFSKDFITPNRLGWTTIGLKDRGQNIHPQNQALNSEYHPQYLMESWSELLSQSSVSR